MNNLITAPNLQDPDAFYARLLELHAGKSEEESAALNTRLILLLANHIGDDRVLNEALEAARLGR
jgi:5-carboxymethyl-2-hydroxymuconate isomerase